MIVALFYVFAGLAAASALVLLFVRNLFHGALLLLICLLSLAAIFVVAFAEFVAVAQILIYAGGILILIIFGIMLTTKIGGMSLRVESSKWFSGSLAGFSLFLALAYLIAENVTGERVGNGYDVANPINQFGIEWMTYYLLPFEIAGLLLLVSLIGAAVVANLPRKTGDA